MITQFRDFDAAAVQALLLDADGNLFPSEEPAFVASTRVVNTFLAEHGVDRRYAPEELQRATLGKNFRTVLTDLSREFGLPDVAPEEVERWVEEERRQVTAYLGETLKPDPRVLDPLTRLAKRAELSVVSSSALSRLDTCFAVTGLAGLLPAEKRFSAEDSLPRPTSKPDPAVYLFAAEQLGVKGEQGLAVEDSVTGTRSAVAAGLPTIGNLLFVAPEDRDERLAALRDAGASVVVSSWEEIAQLLGAEAPAAVPPPA